MSDKITVMIDLDDCIWDLVGNWIEEYKDKYRYTHILDYYMETNEQKMNKSMVVSWDIESCLKPRDKELFWNILDTKEFWERVTIPEATKTALKRLNSHENIDLIICTDTHYKSATHKLTHLFNQLSFLSPSQVICAKEKWRIGCNVVIDDKPETLERFMRKKDPPLVVKIRQPWNEDTIYDASFPRVDEELADNIITFAEFITRR